MKNVYLCTDLNMRTIDQPSLADLIAANGTSSSTDWLEHGRYQHWYLPYRPSGFPFTPVQGYMAQGSYIFAWGNPIVSSATILPAFVDHFSAFVKSQDKLLVWLCVDHEFQEVLGRKFGWSTISCIKEDLIDPTHVLDMMSKKDCGRIKNLRNSLSKATKMGVLIEEVDRDYLAESDLRASVDEGIKRWKDNKIGIQIASTSVNPWLDMKHRRYWLAMLDSTIVGILILTPIHHGHWQIVNVVPFTSSPKGTSEALIHTVLRDIEAEQNILDDDSFHSDSTKGSLSYPRCEFASRDASSAAPGLVTFGISATPDVEPMHNPSEKLETLIKIYNKVAYLGGLFGRSEFRNKFDPKHKSMYVCYPPDLFVKGGRLSLFEDLINALRK